MLQCSILVRLRVSTLKTRTGTATLNVHHDYHKSLSVRSNTFRAPTEPTRSQTRWRPFGGVNPFCRNPPFIRGGCQRKVRIKQQTTIGCRWKDMKPKHARTNSDSRAPVRFATAADLCNPLSARTGCRRCETQKRRKKSGGAFLARGTCRAARKQTVSLTPGWPSA